MEKYKIREERAEVEAVLWTGDNLREVQDFFETGPKPLDSDIVKLHHTLPELIILGRRLQAGSMIVRDGAGNFYDFDQVSFAE